MKWHIDLTKLCLHNKLVYKRLENAEIYSLNGRPHNPNGPACRYWWNSTKKLRLEIYYLHGRYHNLNGPAYREWYANGDLWLEEYYINGNELTGSQFHAILNK